MSRSAQRTASNVSDDDLLPSSGTKTTSPPKQEPGKNASSAGGSVVQKAFEVNAFKMINGQYQLQGRLGVALLAHTSKPEFKVLLYASGSKVVTQAVVTPNFAITVPQRLYVSFYDAFNQSWSLLFDSEDKMEEFVKLLCLARFRVGNCGSIVTVDLRQGEGNPIAFGDAVELKYTGWVLENDNLGTIFETNNSASAKPLRVKLGKGKGLKAWDEGLIGVKRDGRRCLVVPPSKAYGSKGFPPKVPPNSALYFDVEVIRVKLHSHHDEGQQNVIETDQPLNHQRPRIESNSGADDMPLPLLPSDDPIEHEDSVVKERTRSLTEKMEQHSKSNKAELLSRMAKMGQSLIPHSSPPQESEDTDDAPSVPQTLPLTSSTHKVVHPIPKVPLPRPTQGMASNDFPQQPSTGFQAFMPGSNYASEGAFPHGHYPNQPINQPVSSTGQLVMYQSVRPMPEMATMSTPAFTNPMFHAQAPQQTSGTDQLHTAMLVNETRQNNTEVRMAIGKVQEKVDKLLEKVTEQRQESQMVRAGPTVPTMEANTLLQNLSRIIQENERLKGEVYEKSEKIEAQNQKIMDLLAKNQAFIEKNNQDLERNSNSFQVSATQSQSRVLSLEEEKLQLIKDLSQRTSEVYNLQVLLDEHRAQGTKQKTTTSGLQSQLELLEQEMANLKLTNAELHDAMNNAKLREKELKEANRQLQKKIGDFEEKHQDLESERSDTEKTLREKITKIEEDRRALSRELEAIKGEKDREIEDLREKLRQERASVYSDTSMKQNQIEEEITERWKKRCDQLVKAEGEKSERRIREIEEDKLRLQADYDTVFGKMESFKTQSREMKHSMVVEINQLKAEVERLTEKAGEEVVTGKIRGIMNSVFHSVRQKVSADKRYEGATIHQLVKEVIKKTTLRLMGQGEAEEEESEESGAETEEESSEEEEEVSESEQQTSDKNGDLSSIRTENLHATSTSQDAHEGDLVPDIETISTDIPEEADVVNGVASHNQENVLPLEPPSLEEVRESSEPSFDGPADVEENLHVDKTPSEDSKTSDPQEDKFNVSSPPVSSEESLAKHFVETGSDERSISPTLEAHTHSHIDADIGKSGDREISDRQTHQPYETSEETQKPKEPSGGPLATPAEASNTTKPLFSDDEDDFMEEVITRTNDNKQKVTKQPTAPDDTKPTPPPLFGDASDEEDMNWLK